MSHVFKLLGHWALPVNMHDIGDLTNPLIACSERTGKIDFRSFSFPFHSQFPVASKRDAVVFPSVGERSFSLHSVFNKQLFIQQEYILHLHCTLC